MIVVTTDADILRVPTENHIGARANEQPRFRIIDFEGGQQVGLIPKAGDPIGLVLRHRDGNAEARATGTDVVLVQGVDSIRQTGRPILKVDDQKISAGLHGYKVETIVQPAESREPHVKTERELWGSLIKPVGRKLAIGSIGKDKGSGR